MRRHGCCFTSSAGLWSTWNASRCAAKWKSTKTWIGGTQAGLRGSRQLKGRKAALVLVAVEKRGRVTGRNRMALIPDFKNTTLLAFLKQNVMAGSTVYT